MTEAPDSKPPHTPRSWPRRLMIAAAVLLVVFVGFRVLYARALAECQRVSQQCADAGFAWEVVAVVALFGALLCMGVAAVAWVWRLLARFGRLAQLLFALGLLVFLGTAYANFITLGLRAKAGEARANLNKLKKSQIYHHRKHGVYRAAKRAPQPDAHGALMWPEKLPQDSGWAALGWHLVGVRSWCQYEVELQGDGFIARGLCDVDRDGKVGVFEVTQDTSPRRVTPHY